MTDTSVTDVWETNTVVKVVSFDLSFFLLKFIFILRERESLGERVRGGGAEREGDRES